MAELPVGRTASFPAVLCAVYFNDCTTPDNIVMESLGLSRRPKRSPNNLTREDRATQKSDDLLKWVFSSSRPLEKCVTDITGIKGGDGKFYASAAFDCYGQSCPGSGYGYQYESAAVCQKVQNAVKASPGLWSAIFNFDHGS